MDVFKADLNFLTNTNTGRFNPVKNWQYAPKLRFHRLNNMHHTNGFNARGIS
jgi:hypothetical protein